jgi:oligopeptide/dipeptide ABC transporter ATP-binding protein
MNRLAGWKKPLAILGGILIALGVLFPWARIQVPFLSLNAQLRGLDDVGLEMAIAAAAIILLASGKLRLKPQVAGLLIVLIAAVCGVVAAYRIVDLQWARDLVAHRTFSNGINDSIHVAPAVAKHSIALATGLQVITVASLMSIVGGLLIALEGRFSKPASAKTSTFVSHVGVGGALGSRSALTQRAMTPRPDGTADVLVEVRNLKTYYPIFGGILRRRVGSVYAVDDVSLTIYRGEKFGLVGESGCGKTTLGRTILRLEKAHDGSVTMDGQDLLAMKGNALKRMRRRMQLIFQDPYGSLNPRMPVSDIIGEGLLAQADETNGWRRREVRDQRVADYLEAVGLRRDYTRRYAHEFSGGQRQRIGIARALSLDPEFIVCDEPVSALDVSIQSQILNLLSELRDQFNLTYLFIAHNLSVVQYFCDRIGVMYLGKLVEVADTDALYEHPRHPYTVALLSAIPVPDPRVRKKRLVLRGDVPSPANPPSGCRFHTRCWLRERLDNPEQCATVVPSLVDMGGGQFSACHFADKVSAEAADEAAARQSVIDTASTAP